MAPLWVRCVPVGRSPCAAHCLPGALGCAVGLGGAASAACEGRGLGWGGPLWGTGGDHGAQAHTSHPTSLPQLAEVHGVPRGLYDGPVHDVVLSTKAVPTIAASRIAACAGKVPAVPVRNLHQSGFSLSGRCGQGSAGLCLSVLLQGCHVALFPGRSTSAASTAPCGFLTSTPSSLFGYKALPTSLAIRPCLF